MARGWRLLDLTSVSGTMGGARGRVTFITDEGNSQSVPAEEVAVILIGQNTSVTAAVLHYLEKHDVVLLAADWRSVPFAGLYPWSDHSRVAARHIAQAALSLPRKKNAWMQIVKAKVTGQAQTLRMVDEKAADYLTHMVREIRSGDPANVEGSAARYYWPRLFPGSERFIRDQAGEDNVNAMLNYGYMVLRGYGIRAVVTAGLSPPLGLFHRGRSNFFNLVDDLIEPF